MLSKEDMALEALIKVITELESNSHSINLNTFNYAKQALVANGWEVYTNEWGVGTYRRISNEIHKT